MISRYYYDMQGHQQPSRGPGYKIKGWASSCFDLTMFDSKKKRMYDSVQQLLRSKENISDILVIKHQVPMEPTL